MTYLVYHIMPVLALIGTALYGILGGSYLIINTLIALMGLDYLSGILIAIKNRKLSSSIGFKGLTKKLMILVIVAVAHMIDVAIIGHSHTCRKIVIVFYSINETISILENAAHLGLPLPQRLKAVLEHFRKG